MTTEECAPADADSGAGAQALQEASQEATQGDEKPLIEPVAETKAEEEEPAADDAAAGEKGKGSGSAPEADVEGSFDQLNEPGWMDVSQEAARAFPAALATEKAKHEAGLAFAERQFRRMPVDILPLALAEDSQPLVRLMNRMMVDAWISGDPPDDT
ncbi:pks3 [Symbiodinium natans]|uniref:Pks3 protein n=1 Tax=Symbiodinium natans TaxID=878477 RepID=A0A812TV56_9DINO|nr:pks3 [Symbiodinium natans]